jgi:hypothetical protein
MHHQVQQFSDIRLKSLALTRCVRHCQVAFVPVAIAIHEFGGPSRLAPNFVPPFSSQRGYCLCARRIQGLRTIRILPPNFTPKKFKNLPRVRPPGETSSK